MKQSAFLHLAKELEPLSELSDLVVLERVRTRPEHHVFSGVWKGKPVAIKLFLGPDGSDRAFAAFAESKDRDAVMADGALRIAKPVFYERGHSLFLSEWIDGTKLDDLFKSATPAEGYSRYEMAGAWLAAYTQDRRRTRKFGANGWIKRAALRANGKNASLVNALIDRMEAHAAYVHRQDITQARVHGDFIAANLIEAGEHLVGIDIANEHYLALAKDAARFLAQAEAYWASGKDPDHTGLPAKRTAHFLSGLGPLAPLEREHLLPFFYGWELTQRVSEDQTGLPDQANYHHAIDAYLSVG